MRRRDNFLNLFADPQMSAAHSGRITRIVTTDFPQYFAIITRIKQEVHVIGAEGGILTSSVANDVQAVFPPGALTKKIKVGLQVSWVESSPHLVFKYLHMCVYVSRMYVFLPNYFVPNVLAGARNSGRAHSKTARKLRSCFSSDYDRAEKTKISQTNYSYDTCTSSSE